MYLFLMSFAMCVAYLALYFLFPLFFQNKIAPLSPRSFLSIGLIVIMSFAAYAISFSVSDPSLSNRLLHALGGGFVAFFICFRVVKDSKLQINRLQFFVFSFLVVMSLGVANEIVEYFLQEYTGMLFSATTTDTWLDLISNVAGALAAGACFVPFVKSAQKS